jgi:hypothetical protein
MLAVAEQIGLAAALGQEVCNLSCAGNVGE